MKKYSRTNITAYKYKYDLSTFSKKKLDNHYCFLVWFYYLCFILVEPIVKVRPSCVCCVAWPVLVAWYTMAGGDQSLLDIRATIISD